MKFVIQRVSKATVIIDDIIYSSINEGILLLVGIEDNDNDSKLIYYTKKIVNMRIFNDSHGKMNCSLLNTKGSILVVSQFTLCANTTKGNRPSYMHAANPDHARSLYHALIQELKNYEINVKKGRFGAHMKLDIINDGPVTILLGENYG
tara:strand:+ start:72 stop:518 length:447 start_codon:yes stop_codon:yes gene_type:complete